MVAEAVDANELGVGSGGDYPSFSSGLSHLHFAPRLTATSHRGLMLFVLRQALSRLLYSFPQSICSAADPSSLQKKRACTWPTVV